MHQRNVTPACEHTGYPITATGTDTDIVATGMLQVMEPNSDATIICTDGVCRLVHERDLTASRRALHRPSAVRQIMNGQRSVSTHLDLADLDLHFPDHPSNRDHGEQPYISLQIGNRIKPFMYVLLLFVLVDGA